MKRFILGAVLALSLFSPSIARADGSILDQLYAGFVGRAKLSLESTTRGELRPEFLVNYVEIGKLNGSFIAAVDAGAAGTILEDKFESVQWSTGAKLHLAPMIKAYARLPQEWEFLGNMELDLRGSYDWTEHRPYFGLVAAYPFK